MKKDYKICIISIYFGKLPEWIDIWFKTASHNERIDFLFVTDQKVENNLKNIKILNMTFDEFKKIAVKKLGKRIKLNTPYKLCDYKEVWGLILEEQVKEYNYWGECDNDIVIGNLMKFFDKYDLYKYDKFGCRGHFTLYKNIPEVTMRYKLDGGWFGSYKEVFNSNRIWAFDETPGINAIYEKNGFSHMNKIVFGDIDVNYNDLRLVKFEGECPCNYEKQLFYWSNGSLYRKYIEDGKIKQDEFMYIHLQKRSMEKPEFDVFAAKEFIITNGRFIKKDFIISEKEIDIYNKRSENMRLKKAFGGKYKKDLRFYWIGRRVLNIQFDLKSLIKKIILKK